MKKNLIPWLFFLFFVQDDLLAQTAQSCSSFSNPNEILQCVRESHPMVAIQEAEYRSKEHAVVQAGQMPNPEFGFEVIKKKGSGVTSEIALLHTFELGGKGAARERFAQMDSDVSRLENQKGIEELVMNTVVDLYRLRQIRREREITQENIKTFSRLLKKYKRIGKLNPEQRVSVSVFTLAQKENQIKDNALQNEEKQIETRFEIALSRPVVFDIAALPKFSTNWPPLNGKEVTGTDIKIAHKKMDLAEAGLNLEQSNSWPDLSIGPKLDVESAVDGQTEIRAGFEISIPLPFYQANGAGRDKALESVQRRKLALNFAQTQLVKEKRNLRLAYERAVLLMKEMADEKTIESQHSDLHKLLNRGVVSAPLVIESHRQLLEYYESLHEEELNGVRALWRMYALENRILEEKIK